MVDELGTLTFEQIHHRTNALAHALSDAGIVEGDGVAVMCRNHRCFIDATVACSKLGANALYLNTMFAAPQITDVVKREGPRAIVFDEEFAELCTMPPRGASASSAGTSPTPSSGDPTLAALIEGGDTSDVVPPAEKGRVVILTSGTTGTPKGASRSQPETLDPAAALLSKIPLHARERTMIAAPMFHSWGFAHFTLGMALSSTLVLRRRFDPEGTLAATAQHRCTALAVVPVMLQRILELGDDVIARYDLSSLRVIAVSGSALPGELATRTMDAFGDVLYNLYGSTEVAWATIATPADMRAAPGTAGRAPRGTVLKIVDEQRPRAPHGRDRVASSSATRCCSRATRAAGSRSCSAELMSTGDVGHLDDEGRLFVEGRDDEMIVSGGENVFPAEVEDLLARHEAVREVAVIGVEDEKFGQRLKAFVVVRDGAKLDRRRGEGLRTRQPGELQGAARGRVHRGAAPQRHRQGPQARAAHQRSARRDARAWRRTAGASRRRRRAPAPRGRAAPL